MSSTTLEELDKNIFTITKNADNDTFNLACSEYENSKVIMTRKQLNEFYTDNELSILNIIHNSIIVNIDNKEYDELLTFYSVYC